MKCRIKGERSLRCLGLIWLISSESSSRKKVELKFLTDIVCRLCSSRTMEKKWKEGGKEGWKEGKEGGGDRGGKGEKEDWSHFLSISFINTSQCMGRQRRLPFDHHLCSMMLFVVSVFL